MILVTCEPLEGVLVGFCKTLPTGWMLDPMSGASFDEEHCTLKMEDVAFGGILVWLEDETPPFPPGTLAFGGLDVTFLAHDIT
jgi:hypothetical protein